MEKPVISTRVGGVLEMNSPNLHVIDHLDEIQKILSSSIKAEPDPNFITDYSLERVISSFEAMFDDCLKEISI